MAQDSSSDALMRKKRTFYDRGDAKFIFSDGKEIKINKSLLAFNCDYFDKMFFVEPLKNEYYVEDFDSGTFQIFLDCLMGFKDYNDLDALLIFPIAHKYQAEESLKQCIEVLKPSKMSPTVCKTLNLALYYECKELVESIMVFLQDKFNIKTLWETNENCFLLEPHSVARLVEISEMDSYLLEIICNWAENYLRKSNSKKDENVGTFLREHKIVEKIREFKFESFQSIFDFQKAGKRRDLFTQEQLWAFLKDKIVINNPRKFPTSSDWVSVEKGDKFIETLQYVKHFDLTLSANSKTIIQVWRNETIFTETIPAGQNPITCEMTFEYDRCFYNSSYMEKKQSGQNYKFDKNSTYSKKDKKYIYEITFIPPSEDNTLFLPKTFSFRYIFNVNCKILKTSLDERYSDNNENLYYTYAITEKH